MRNPETAPPAMSIHASFGDFDHFAEFTQAWDLDFRQMGGGALNAELKQIVASDWALGWVRFDRTALQKGASIPGLRTFGLLEPGAPGVDWCGTEFAQGDLIVFPKDRDYRSVSQAGFSVHTLSFAEAELSAACERLDIPDVCDGLPVHEEVRRVDDRRLRLLKATIDRAYAALSTPGVVFLPADQLERFRHGICEKLVLALADPASAVRPVSWRKLTASINRTLPYIEANLRDAVNVGDVARATGVSRRTLEYAFRKQFGQSPKAFINEQRLICARRELLLCTPGSRVVDVANHWGYWHMGQFARDYRKLFGELPSETLGR